MNRRGFLKVMVGGVAVAALPAIPVIAAPSQKAGGFRYSEAVRNAMMDGVAPHKAAYLVVTLVESGERRPLYFPLDPQGWEINRGTATYAKPISIQIDGPCWVDEHIQIVDGDGNWLVEAALFVGPLRPIAGDVLHVSVAFTLD
jgi:hypothetical protein